MYYYADTADTTGIYKIYEPQVGTRVLCEGKVYTYTSADQLENQKINSNLLLRWVRVANSERGWFFVARFEFAICLIT